MMTSLDHCMPAMSLLGVNHASLVHLLCSRPTQKPNSECAAPPVASLSTPYYLEASCHSRIHSSIHNSIYPLSIYIQIHPNLELQTPDSDRLQTPLKHTRDNHHCTNIIISKIFPFSCAISCYCVLLMLLCNCC